MSHSREVVAPAGRPIDLDVRRRGRQRCRKGAAQPHAGPASRGAGILAPLEAARENVQFVTVRNDFRNGL